MSEMVERVAHEEFEFGELRFTKKELRSLDKRIFSLIVGSSIAANDVAILQRLFIFHTHEPSGSGIGVAYTNINSLVLLRLLSAKLYEYVYFIEGFATKLQRKPAPALATFLKHATDFLALKGDPEFATIKYMRDNVTHHYHGATEISILDSFPDDQLFVDFHHDNSGNSLSALGEEFATFGLLNSRNDGIDYKGFMEWTKNTSAKVTNFHQLMLIDVLKSFFPDKKAIARKALIERSLIGDVNTRSPVLFSPVPLPRDR